jgi:glycosyltransferase involved in cell wall biosynthesis
VHVGLLIYGSLDTITGGFIYDRYLVQHLRGHGDRVEVIVLPWGPYLRSLPDNLNRNLERRLRQANFDVLIQDELVHPSCFWLNRDLRGSTSYPIISLVLHLRSCEQHPLWKHWFHRWIEKKYLESVDGFIFISHAIRRAAERLGSAGQPWVVAYGGGDRLPGSTTPNDIRRRALQSGPLQIVAMANVIRRKGLHSLLAALAQLPRGQWRLRVAGNLTDDPAYVQKLRQQITELGLNDQVFLLGTLSARELSSLLHQAHVLALLPYYEALGIVNLEAMRAGLPAIASTAGGAQEVMTHGREGFLVEPGDVAALADCLQLLISDRQRLLAMSLAAWERSRTHPTWEDSMGRVRDFLVTMISK